MFEYLHLLCYLLWLIFASPYVMVTISIFLFFIFHICSLTLSSLLYCLLFFSRDVYASVLCDNSTGQLIDPSGNIHLINVIHLFTYLAELMFLSISFILNMCRKLNIHSCFFQFHQLAMSVFLCCLSP